MAKDVSVTNSGGISALGLLGCILVVLKVLGKISLSWFWVLAPFWVGLAFVAVVLILAAIVGIFMAMAK